MNFVSFFISNLSLSFAVDNEFVIDVKACLNLFQKVILINHKILDSKIKKKLIKKLSISSDQAKNILNYFLKENILFEDHNHMIGINILANRTRKQIYNLIKRKPGIYVHRIQQELNLGSHQLIYHLGTLVEFKIIKFLKINNIRAFGCFDVLREEILLGFLLNRKNVRQILKIIISFNNPCSMVQLCEQSKSIKRATIQYNLKMLMNNKLIKLSLIESQKTYQIFPKYYKMVEKIL